MVSNFKFLNYFHENLKPCRPTKFYASSVTVMPRGSLSRSHARQPVSHISGPDRGEKNLPVIVWTMAAQGSLHVHAATLAMPT